MTKVMDFISTYLSGRAADVGGTDIYGPSKADEPAVKGAAEGRSAVRKTRTVIQLSICDSVAAHGLVTDLAFSLARNGVRFISFLINLPRVPRTCAAHCFFSISVS